MPPYQTFQFFGHDLPLIDNADEAVPVHFGPEEKRRAQWHEARIDYVKWRFRFLLCHALFVLIVVVLQGLEQTAFSLPGGVLMSLVGSVPGMAGAPSLGGLFRVLN